MISDDSSSESDTGRFKSQSANSNEKDYKSSSRSDYGRNLDHYKSKRSRERSPRSSRYSPVRHDKRDYAFNNHSERKFSHEKYKGNSEKKTLMNKSIEAKEKDNQKRRSPDKNSLKSRERSPLPKPKPIHTSQKESVHHKKENCLEKGVNRDEKVRSISSMKSDSLKRTIQNHLAKNETICIRTDQNKPSNKSIQKSCELKHNKTEKIRQKIDPPKPSKQLSDPETLSDSTEDEETLRAKLLELKNELRKTKEKKHKKHRHKQQSKTSDEAPVIQALHDIHANEIVDFEDDHKKKVTAAGPALPPHLAKKYNVMEDSGAPSNSVGAALPLALLGKTKVFGPQIPEKTKTELANKAYSASYDSSDDDCIGPLPSINESTLCGAQLKLEERALELKLGKLGGGNSNVDVKQREEWMLELPEVKAKAVGLGPASFRTREAPDMSDRSSWTDTPEVKAKKAAGIIVEREDSAASLQKDAHASRIKQRDQEQELAVKKHKKKHKRDESLLELHQKKLKKEKKRKEEKSGKAERRPFDRNVDLQVNKFDEAQKRRAIDKAQFLNSRFSSGEAKYL